MPIDTDPVVPARAVTLPSPATGEDPVTVTATIVTIKRRDEPGAFSRVVGLDATLNILFPGDSTPDSLSLSRLIGETFWLQDSHIGPTGYPHFVHGFGSRSVQKHGVPPELEALLDEAARSRGLAAEIGPDIPLVLTATTNPADTDEHA